MPKSFFCKILTKFPSAKKITKYSTIFSTNWKIKKEEFSFLCPINLVLMPLTTCDLRLSYEKTAKNTFYAPKTFPSMNSCSNFRQFFFRTSTLSSRIWIIFRAEFQWNSELTGISEITLHCV